MRREITLTVGVTIHTRVCPRGRGRWEMAPELGPETRGHHLRKQILPWSCQRDQCPGPGVAPRLEEDEAGPP